jgi:hypothetical protein
MMVGEGYNLAQDQSDDITMPGPAPDALPVPGSQDAYARFEVIDASDEEYLTPIPGAQVTIADEEGNVILSKLTDAGGNASFSIFEVNSAVGAANLPAEEVLWWEVEAEGFEPQGDQLQAKQLHSVGLKKPATNILTYVAVAGVALVGLVVLGVIKFK